MANPLQPTTDLIVSSFGLFAQEIKRISQEAKNAETADMALDAQKLEGLTLDQIVELIAGTAGLTVAQVKQELDDFIASLIHVPTDKADATTVMETDNNSVIVTPQALWSGIEAWWATQVGAAPETLNEIHEIANALQNNPDIITVIQDQVALKATKAELADEAARLEGLITAGATEFASQVEVDAGVETGKAVAPDTLQVKLDAAVAAMQTSIMTDVDASLVAMNNAIVAAIAELQSTEDPTP